MFVFVVNIRRVGVNMCAFFVGVQMKMLAAHRWVMGMIMVQIIMGMSVIVSQFFMDMDVCMIFSYNHPYS